jgi:hypothetical protein
MERLRLWGRSRNNNKLLRVVEWVQLRGELEQEHLFVFIYDRNHSFRTEWNNGLIERRKKSGWLYTHTSHTQLITNVIDESVYVND